MGKIVEILSNIISKIFDLVIELVRFLTHNLFILPIIIIIILIIKYHKPINSILKKVVSFFSKIFDFGNGVFKDYKDNIKSKNIIDFNIVSNLEKIILMNDLSVMKYPYASIATIYEDEGKESETSDIEEIKKNLPSRVLYKIKYKGYVSIGFDASKLNTTIDKFHKLILVKIPELNKIEPHVDIDSIETIYYNYETKYNASADFINTAYKECIEDMRYKIYNDEEIMNMARLNAINSIMSIIKPFTKNKFLLKVE